MEEYLQPHFYILSLAEGFPILNRSKLLVYFSAYAVIEKNIDQNFQKKCINLPLIDDHNLLM